MTGKENSKLSTHNHPLFLVQAEIHLINLIPVLKSQPNRQKHKYDKNPNQYFLFFGKAHVDKI